MGDKGKGKQSGGAKKAKNAKVGQRPHEVRQQEALKNGVPEPGKGVLGERSR